MENGTEKELDGVVFSGNCLITWASRLAVGHRLTDQVLTSRKRTVTQPLPVPRRELDTSGILAPLLYAVGERSDIGLDGLQE